MEQTASKRKRPANKAMPKKTRADLVKLVKCIEPTLLTDEVWNNVEEKFSDSKLAEFVRRLFEHNEPMIEIAEHHCDAFAALYDKCKPMKNSFMQFQL